MTSEEKRLLDGDEMTASDPSISTSSTAADSVTIAQLERSPKNRWFLMEPAILLLFFAISLSSAVFQNLVLYQTCTVVFKYNKTSCSFLLGIKREEQTPESKTIEETVQEYVTYIYIFCSIFDGFISAFISFFLGPWSDKFGRRPVILLTLTGNLFSYVIMTVINFISVHVEVSPWFYSLSSIPSVFLGGTCTLITVTYCYICDVIVSGDRDLRMVLNEASLLIGLITGSVAISFIYELIGSVNVLAMCCGAMILAIIYVVLFVPESLRQDQISSGSKIREFFRWNLAKDLLKTCCERRQNHDRAIIWLIMLALALSFAALMGDGGVTYLFTRERFQWTLEDYSLFNAAGIVIQIGGSLIGMIVLRKFLGFSIISMCLMSIGSCVLESTVRATAVYSWQMYLGAVLGTLRGVSGPMCRAILSQVAPTGDLGKVFALSKSLESISPMASGTLYNLVYRETLVYNPGAFNYISIGVNMTCYILMAVVYGILKAFPFYKDIGS